MRILTRRELEELLTFDRVVGAVEEAFAAYGRGEAMMPPKVYLDLPAYHGDFRAMPAFMPGVGAGVKWVNSHPENPERHGLPSVLGVYVLSDPATARPLAILDGTWLTAARTGAAAAVASKHLARPGAATIGFVGCGAQAPVMWAAHQVTHPDGLEPVFFDTRREAAEALAAKLGGRVGSLAHAAGCDIVCTSTPSREPVVRLEQLTEGAHVNAMGADAEGKQELDPRILQQGRVFVDDPAQALHSGEVNVPIHFGIYSEDQLAGTLGDVLCGRHEGRGDARWTVFDSTGLAIQDVAVARVAYDLAVAADVGLTLDLTGTEGG